MATSSDLKLLLTFIFRRKADAKAYFSRLGNNGYVLLPYKFARQPLCNIINEEYRNRIMHDVKSYSNGPVSDDPNVDLCDLWPLVR